MTHEPQSLKALLRLAWAPLAPGPDSVWQQVSELVGIMIALGLIALVLVSTASDGTAPLVGFVSVCIGVAEWVVISVLAVRVHRWYLLGEIKSAPRESVIRYVLWGIGIGLLILLPLLLAALVTAGMERGWVRSVPTIFVVIAAIYAFGRLSLVLPDRAIGRSNELDTVMGWTRGAGWKAIAVLVGPQILLTMGILLLTWPLSSAPVSIIETAIAPISAVVGVVCLSVCYSAFGPGPSESDVRVSE